MEPYYLKQRFSTGRGAVLIGSQLRGQFLFNLKNGF